MDSLKNVISDIRIFLYGGVLTLPLTIGGTLALLGLCTANYAMLFFLIGFLVLVPLFSTLLDKVIGSFVEGKSFNPFTAKVEGVCNLAIPYSVLPIGEVKTKNVVSSAWVAMVAFFIGYIFTNGLELYSRESPDTTITVTSTSASDLNTMVTNRKSQAIIAMVSTIVFGLIVLGFRYYTGCESTLGMILTTILFVFAGHGWYQALSRVGQDRLSDLFGIANRLLPPSAINNAPIACVPVPSGN